MRAVLDTAPFIWVNIMKEFSYQGWDFRVDTERAAAFYRNAPVSAHGLSEYLPELTAFMRALEIDIEKPFCISAHDPHYYFFGNAHSEEKFEIDFCVENKFVSVVVFPDSGGRWILALYGLPIITTSP